MLQNTNERKIIMVSGSSSSFGLDQKMLEEKTGYEVVNLGLHAGFGYLFYSELAKENINSGDIVLLGYEYGWVNDFDSLGQDLIMSGIDNNIDMYMHIPVKKWPDFVGYIFKYAEKKNTFKGASGIYSREAFDNESGQMTWVRDYAMSDYNDNVSTYGTISIVNENGNVTISDNSIEYLKNLKKYVEERGAKIYFVSPPVLYDSVDCEVEDFLKLAELEEKEIGIPYISDPRLYMFPIDLMSNAVYHCNSEGEKIRTNILVDDLRLCGAIEGISVSDIIKEEKGETFSLVDTLPKRFLHNPKLINRVYRINEEGETVQYQEGTDYIIDYERGTIRRTQDSSIPNYRLHQVSYSGGKFTWISDSENYNPESNRNYHIRVDYDYNATENEIVPISNQSVLLSEELRNKILSGENIEIVLCGDSIGSGVDTDGRGIFLHYLTETLEAYYNIEVDAKQLSLGGASCDHLLDNMNDIIEEHPDLLLIEFGMNDHCGTDASSKERVIAYKEDIKKVVENLQNNGIDIILIGFFQQNMTWDEENMEATKSYNAALQNIAQSKGIYFADIYDIFYRVGNRKHLNRDVMADYIHHPTEWGHKLYFTALLDVFNIDGEMKPIDIDNYVYVEE